MRHLVRVSGAAADPASPAAVARVQGQADEHLLASGISTTLLRPKNFMQNFTTFMAGMIRNGTVYSSQADGRTPFIDVRDIADVAARVLQAPQAHAGQAYVLTGPEALTNAQALDEIGRAIGRRIEFVAIPESAAVESMQKMGMPPFVVEVMSSLNQIIAAAAGSGARGLARTPCVSGAVTGRPRRR